MVAGKLKIVAAALSVAYVSFSHGANLETETLQAQIDAASRSGGGRVVVTEGRHLTGQLYLRNNVELHLEAGAVLEGAVGLHNYVVHYLPFSEGTMSAIVMGLGVTNVAITGSGEIFGNGREFERIRTVGGCEEGFRPRGIFIGDSRNIRLEGFTLRDAACWGIVIQRCEDVVARKVNIDSVVNANNDGFDIEARNVLIEDCDVHSSDDGICLKSNDPGYVVENVAVRNCRVSSHCSVMKLGTATHGTMRNIRFEHVVVVPPRRFFRDLVPMPKDLTVNNSQMGVPEFLCGPAMAAICVECVDGGVVENVVFDDIDVSGASVLLHIRGGFRSGRACGIPPRNEKILRGIVISNVRGRAEQARPSTILGCDACRVRDVTLRNVDIECVGEGAERNAKPYSIPGEEVAGMYPDAFLFKDYHLPSYGLFADHADDIRLENVRFTLRKGTKDSRPAVMGVGE